MRLTVDLRGLSDDILETIWTRIFDGLSVTWDKLSVSPEQLPSLIARAPEEKKPIVALRHLEQRVAVQRQKVDEVLGASQVDLTGHSVVVRLDNALGLPR